MVPCGTHCSSHSPAAASSSMARKVSKCPVTSRRQSPRRPSSSSVPGARPRPPWPPRFITVRFAGWPVVSKASRMAQNMMDARWLPPSPETATTWPSSIMLTAERGLMKSEFSGTGGG